MFKNTSLGIFCQRILCLLDCAAPIGDLILRIWVANVFWKSGLTKISNIDSTMYLFEYEYAVPIIPFELAAYLAIAAELVLPLMLVFGFAARAAAGALFVFNIIAVVSYSALNAVGIAQHQVWGIMLLVLLLRGPGQISIDYFIRKRILGHDSRSP
ncbi:MAG: DoxX family protein [Acidiferrobacterales bacterium]|nr:DoxX family protein [Acidiferrobacterales bacterium]